MVVCVLVVLVGAVVSARGLRLWLVCVVGFFVFVLRECCCWVRAVLRLLFCSELCFRCLCLWSWLLGAFRVVRFCGVMWLLCCCVFWTLSCSLGLTFRIVCGLLF